MAKKGNFPIGHWSLAMSEPEKYRAAQHLIPRNRVAPRESVAPRDKICELTDPQPIQSAKTSANNRQVRLSSFEPSPLHGYAETQRTHPPRYGTNPMSSQPGKLRTSLSRVRYRRSRPRSYPAASERCEGIAVRKIITFTLLHPASAPVLRSICHLIRRIIEKEPHLPHRLLWLWQRW